MKFSAYKKFKKGLKRWLIKYVSWEAKTPENVKGPENNFWEFVFFSKIFLIHKKELVKKVTEIGAWGLKTRFLKNSWKSKNGLKMAKPPQRALSYELKKFSKKNQILKSYFMGNQM